jgi:hypothetical protein
MSKFEKQNPIENPLDGFATEKYRSKKWTIRMEITMNRDMSQEDAEMTIFSALRSAGMKAHRGSIY